jgi:hypothetical protein
MGDTEQRIALRCYPTGRAQFEVDGEEIGGHSRLIVSSARVCLLPILGQSHTVATKY